MGSATAEISFSVLIRLKTYARSTMENDRLSSLGLMHIHRDFEIDLYKTMEVFVSVKKRRTDLGHFKKFLSIKVIKIVLDSILYETLKWPQIAPFCISSKKKPLKNYRVHTIKTQLRPCWWFSPASSTTKAGRHDILVAEILLNVALNTKNQIKSLYPHKIEVYRLCMITNIVK